MRRFEDLKGKTLTKVENIDDEEIVFTLDDGRKFKLFHLQDCCEDVRVDDICGDLANLIGSPILQAIESSNINETPDGMPAPDEFTESYTWTFYHLATVKGFVAIRFYGASNGYYSESVNFEQI